jgi:hypothetical protein
MLLVPAAEPGVHGVADDVEGPGGWMGGGGGRHGDEQGAGGGAGVWVDGVDVGRGEEGLVGVSAACACIAEIFLRGYDR